MSRITEYTSVSAFDENDVLIKDGENGTKIISVEDAAAEFRRLCGINGDISNITDSLSAFGTNLAGVETTFIATKNYNIGDLFVIDNVLYRATATIASGSEIDPETNCEETSFSTVIEAMKNDILAGKADANGTYDNLIAGSAKQLVGTVFTEDDAAYTFRTAGGSADIGDREYDEIVGGSIVWNQLSQTNRNQNTVYGLNYVIENGVARIWGTWGGINGGEFRMGDSNIPIPANHVLFVDTGLTDNVIGCRVQGEISGKRPNNSIIKLPTSNLVCSIVISVYLDTNTEIDITFIPQLFDLTQMFGSEIADYIYSLERTTTGAGVAWFRKYFPKTYYEYNAGELMHVSDLQSHDMVGFNVLNIDRTAGTLTSGSGTTSIRSDFEYDKYYIGLTQNNYYNPTFITEYEVGQNRIKVNNDHVFYGIGFPVRVLPNTTYRATRTIVFGDLLIAVGYYDAEGNHIGYGVITNTTFTTPSRCYTAVIVCCSATSNTVAIAEDLNVNLSWDGERDGEYEPYVKHSYPLDSSLTLRGIPKLSTDGKLYYDGDHYKSDGTVERRYGIVDLGTLDWVIPGGDFSNVYKSSVIADIKPNGTSGTLCNAICDKYTQVAYTSLNSSDKSFAVVWSHSTAAKTVYFKDSSYDDAASFKEAMSGVYLVYELAEPTTEEAQPFQSPQIVDDFGTEEYVTSSIVPVGHITQYDSNLRAKLEMAPNSPDGDGDYLVRQTGGQNEYVPYTDSGRITALEGKIPAPPSTDGAYVLKCTVTDGTPTYSWVSA